MINFFLDLEEAKKIVDIIHRDWTCFEHLESYLMRNFGEKTTFIMMALRKIMREESPRGDEIHRAWLEYTGGEPIRLSELRRKAKKFCEKYGFAEERFWKWWNGETRLEIIEEINVEKIMGMINYFVLRYMLSMSQKAVMWFPSELEGKVIKEAKYRAIYINADIEFENEEEFSVIKIVPSNRTLEIFAGLGEYARRILVEMSNKKIMIENIPIIGSLEWEEYDSIIEKTLAYYLELNGAKVKREPIAIRLGDLIFIPDFQVTYGNKSILVEIVGYWRKKYIINKEIKIRRALRKGIQMIIVAHKNIAQKLKHLNTIILEYSNIKELEMISTKIISILK